MSSDNEKWHRFDLLLANFQSVSKSQSRFVNTLALFLCLVWTVDLLNRSGEITVQVLGVSIQVHGFWQVVPLICGILCLGLIGSINIIHHAWRRLILYLPEDWGDAALYGMSMEALRRLIVKAPR